MPFSSMKMEAQDEFDNSRLTNAKKSNSFNHSERDLIKPQVRRTESLMAGLRFRQKKSEISTSKDPFTFQQIFPDIDGATTIYNALAIKIKAKTDELSNLALICNHHATIYKTFISATKVQLLRPKLNSGIEKVIEALNKALNFEKLNTKNYLDLVEKLKLKLSTIVSTCDERPLNPFQEQEFNFEKNRISKLIESLSFDKLNLPKKYVTCLNSDLIHAYERKLSQFEKLTHAIIKRKFQHEKNMKIFVTNIENNSQIENLISFISLSDRVMRESGECGKNSDFKNAFQNNFLQAFVNFAKHEQEKQGEHACTRVSFKNNFTGKTTNMYLSPRLHQILIDKFEPNTLIDNEGDFPKIRLKALQDWVDAALTRWKQGEALTNEEIIRFEKENLNIHPNIARHLLVNV